MGFPPIAWLLPRNPLEPEPGTLATHPDLAAEHPGLRRTDGLIGVQSHNGRVEFRDLRLKELAPPRRD